MKAATATARAEIQLDDQANGKVVVTMLDEHRDTVAAQVATLTPNETRALIERMEPLPDLTAKNANAPTMRAPSPRPPRGGPVEPIAFVVPQGKQVADAPARPMAAAAKPLTPPQITPIGDITTESEIRVRFDEPMVPVATLASAPPPAVTVAPAVAGRWHWIDTRVLELSPTNPRLPMATEFTVTVRAGTRALGGATLAADATGKFATAPVKIAGVYPTRTVRPDSPVLVRFDQEIESAKLLPLLHVDVPKGKRLRYHTIDLAAARALWAKNPSLDKDPAPTSERAIIVAPDGEWPAGSDLQIVLDGKAPSAEGPLLSKTESYQRFTVAKPFALRGIACDDDNKPKLANACSANGIAYLEFTNDVGIKTYHADKIQIAGESFRDNAPNGSNITFWTPKPVGRTYTLTIGDGIADIYGQELGGPRRADFTTTVERFWPWVYGPAGLIVLDPRYQIPQWVLEAQAIASLRIQLYRVQPSDYFAFETFERNQRAAVPGTLVHDKTYPIGARFGADLRVDLRPALNAQGLGHVVAVATAQPAPGTKKGWLEPRRVAWIQVSKLGVVARTDGEKANAWVQDLSGASFLAPRTDVALSILGRTGAAAPGKTDAEGHAAFDLLPPPAKASPNETTALLMATSGADSTFAAIEGGTKTIRGKIARWYVTDDRFTYRPGEKVYVKGWVRWTDDGVNPDLALPSTKDAVTYSLADSMGNKIGKGTAELTDRGGFDFEIQLPPNANLGHATLTVETKGDATTHPISIQEFRTPAYAVALDDDIGFSGSLPVIAGERVEMLASAHYYSGGGLPGANLAWDATLSAASYRPPNWNLFTFDPPEERSRRGYYRRRGLNSRETVTVHDVASLSGASTAGATFDIAAVPQGRPSILTVDATVEDVDRMHIRATSRQILVHPSTYYVGIRQLPGRGTLALIVTDLDGNAVRGVPITVTIEGVAGSEMYRDDAKVMDTQTCAVTSGDAPVTCTFTYRDNQFAYTATAHIADKRGRANVAEYPIPWITWADPKEDLVVRPDQSSYRPGDTAKVEIHSGTLPATAVVSFARQGVITQKRVELKAKVTTVDVPIEEAYIQNVHVLVDRWSQRASASDHIPEHRSAQLDLPVDVESARLVMKARADKPIVEPGAMASFEVEVRHDGKPQADAEVALMVVDEAVLALAARHHADPLPMFFSHVGDGTQPYNTLELVQDDGENVLAPPGFSLYDLGLRGTGHGSGSGSGYGMGAGGFGTIGHGSGVVTARQDFRANALFAPRLRTGADGKARVSVKMPDSLTRFRIVALASATARYFGIAEGSIVTQRKLNARTVAPRFLTQGDAFALPIVVQNLDMQPRTVDVAVRAANLVTTGVTGKRVTVAGGQRAEVRFDFATKARGKAVIQTIVTSGTFADASNVELPVYEPATTEAFATYGVVDGDSKFEQLAVPKDVFTDVGGVEVELASTQMQSLTDAFWYLYAYPYECAEQRSGRMLATASMYDILDAFGTPGRPPRAEIEATLANDLKILARDQLGDGSWGYFPGMPSNAFVTQQVLTALAARKQTTPVAKKAIAFVTQLANAKLAALGASAAKKPADRLDRATYPGEVSLAAAALSSLAVAGVDVTARAEKLHALATALEAYPIDAKARVLAILAKLDRAKPVRAKLLADLLSATHETASSATVTTSYVESERMLLVSSTKTTALALDAIMREAPDHALVTKLARGILDARRRGRWTSTQENVVVLAAMRHYFDIYEKATPKYTGKLWFGEKAYTERDFIGRSNVRATAALDWTTLTPGSTHDLALVKAGDGRMYYRVGITYAPKQTNLPALDAGFVVRRSYTAVDDPSDVAQTPQGWKVKLGARVLVTIEAINTTKRYDVAFVDPLPAGFEAVNTELATSERAVVTVGNTRWDHTAMRDNRAEAFAIALAEGNHAFTYTARATTPGTFLAAPAKAEEMYAPETFGRSAGSVVTIE